MKDKKTSSDLVTLQKLKQTLSHKKAELPLSLQTRYQVNLLNKMLFFLEHHAEEEDVGLEFLERLKLIIAQIAIEFPIQAEKLKTCQKDIKQLESDFLEYYGVKPKNFYSRLMLGLGMSTGIGLSNLTGLTIPFVLLNLALGGTTGLLLGKQLDKRQAKKHFTL